MKIIAVCGMGIGTSILLKMNLDKVAAELDLDADVEAADITSARGAASMADLVVTSEELVSELGDLSVPIKVVSNFTDLDEIRSLLAKHA